MSFTFMQASRPIVRARSTSNSVRPFSIVVPARLEGEMQVPKLRGFLAEKGEFPRREIAAFDFRPQEAGRFRRLQQQASTRRQQLEDLEKYM
ncbi:hypothetical protein BDV25DRAFT_135025 [Aspergillus avenaceus]|uniref:Uncharacterized protein n=1 Tax=Aspergillus avenaceus TaxID=36643 RepID=A0A5N6U9K4_ASPAV|nr:hypothetical protein BDV25DRAFT_135025 [Aspergillus avenaceus]